MRSYDILPDGSFVTVRGTATRDTIFDSYAAHELHVVLNFSEELKRRAAGGGKPDRVPGGDVWKRPTDLSRWGGITCGPLRATTSKPGLVDLGTWHPIAGRSLLD